MSGNDVLLLSMSLFNYLYSIISLLLYEMEFPVDFYMSCFIEIENGVFIYFKEPKLNFKLWIVGNLNFNEKLYLLFL